MVFYYIVLTYWELPGVPYGEEGGILNKYINYSYSGGKNFAGFAVILYKFI